MWKRRNSIKWGDFFQSAFRKKRKERKRSLYISNDLIGIRLGRELDAQFHLHHSSPQIFSEVII